MKHEELYDRWTSKTMEGWEGINRLPDKWIEKVHAALLMIEEVDSDFSILMIKEYMGTIQVHILGNEEAQHIVRQIENSLYQKPI